MKLAHMEFRPNFTDDLYLDICTFQVPFSRFMWVIFSRFFCMLSALMITITVNLLKAFRFSWIFRLTSESRPNSIEGEMSARPSVRPSVRPYVRPSVRPQKVSSI